MSFRKKIALSGMLIPGKATKKVIGMIIVRFFPNGEFSQGFSSPKKKKSKAEELSRLLSSKLPPIAQESCEKKIQSEFMDGYWKAGDKFFSKCGSVWMFLEVDSFNRSVYTVTREDGEVFVIETHHTTNELIRNGDITSTYLGLSNGRILDSPKVSRKKCLSMTTNMKRNIRNGVYLLEQKYGIHDLSFLTLTIPGLPLEDLKLINENWDTAVNRILKWLRNKCKRKGYDVEYVYCTEIQPKRLEKRGEYVPHLHIVFNGRKSKRRDWSISPKMVRFAWHSIVKSYVAGDFNDSALENLQRIRKSAASYMAKYLSKGKSPDDGSNKRPTEELLKTHWGGMSRGLCKAIKQACTRMSSSSDFREFVLFFIRNLSALSESRLIRWYRRGVIPLGGNSEELQEWGLHVCSGLLTRPTFEGGLSQIFEYFENYKSEV